ncbi:Ribonuclease K6 [Fukomys damarensis]|uniref:Ribonuclease K6 n=1 Tax=Fukomys damarensis TaxID=885580 RepID=A0A091DQY8_FUKDA|nr:Ribonuclease K6 [Fukomys damarensis]
MVRDVRFHLPLLLGLFVLLCPIWPMLGSHTPSSWFETQHLLKKKLPCNMLMSKINNYKSECKASNTFLHVSFQSVVDVCTLPAIPCKKIKGNICHQSKNPVNVTKCVIRSRTPCTYSDFSKLSKFTVACQHRFNNPHYPLLPFHLD